MQIHLQGVMQEVSAQILFTSLKRAWGNSYLLILPKADQNVLIEESWNELFLLTACFWPLDITMFQKPEVDIKVSYVWEPHD